jgi:aldehyde dehydrogenase (NAD+)
MEAKQMLPVQAANGSRPDSSPEIARVFALQQANRARVRHTSAAERIAKLKRLRDAIIAHRPALYQALLADFRKAPTETDLTEVMPVLVEIQHTIRHLKAWMHPAKVATPLLFAGTRGEIRYEPKGVVLIISPWNFPINLTLGPLIAAIAAGNCAILKPSEYTPHTSSELKALLAGVFPPEEVALFEGDHRVAQALLKHPFDHVFFTGSPQVGKLVMKAAAEHLASVTLELGGKSPVIVDETADVPAAAKKIAIGKFVNSGQICIAPDYLLVHERVHDALVAALVENVKAMYGATEAVRAATPDYARMIDARHQERVQRLYESALRGGAQAPLGGRARPDDCYIAPTLLTNVPPDSAIMQEEIFGPVLPILPFAALDEALGVINSKPKPLTIYIFSGDKANVERILQHTTAGTTLVNDTLVHFIDPELPFGGVNHSGIGKAHGHHGFLAFSNERPVLTQRLKKPPVQLLFPPYTKKVNVLRDLFFKYLHL